MLLARFDTQDRFRHITLALAIAGRQSVAKSLHSRQTFSSATQEQQNITKLRKRLYPKGYCFPLLATARVLLETRTPRSLTTLYIYISTSPPSRGLFEVGELVTQLLTTESTLNTPTGVRTSTIAQQMGESFKRDSAQRHYITWRECRYIHRHVRHVHQG